MDGGRWFFRVIESEDGRWSCRHGRLEFDRHDCLHDALFHMTAHAQSSAPSSVYVHHRDGRISNVANFGRLHRCEAKQGTDGPPAHGPRERTPDGDDRPLQPASPDGGFKP
jgi:hypothetical protein